MSLFSFFLNTWDYENVSVNMFGMRLCRFFLFLLPPSCHTWCQATSFVSLDDETLSPWKDDDINNIQTRKWQKWWWWNWHECVIFPTLKCVAVDCFQMRLCRVFILSTSCPDLFPLPGPFLSGTILMRILIARWWWWYHHGLDTQTWVFYVILF